MADVDFAKQAARPPSPLHQNFVDWIAVNAGVQLDTETVALALRLHPHYRKDADYAASREALAAQRITDKAATAQRVAAKAAEQLAALDLKRAALEAKIAGVTPAQATPIVTEPVKAAPVTKPKAVKATPVKAAKATPVKAVASPAPGPRGRPAAKATAPVAAVPDLPPTVQVDDEADPF